MISTKHARMGFHCEQLLDSGADRELVSWSFVRKRRLEVRALRTPILLEYMDGRKSSKLTHETVQDFRMKGRVVRINYLVCDIAEDIVLGHRWLRKANPDIDWALGVWNWRDQESEPRRWREAARVLRVALTRVVPDAETIAPLPAREVITARKARKRIVQAEIEYNDPPEWVRERHAGALGEREPGSLPPVRPGWDYRVQMKPGFRPRKDKGRRFSPEERRMFQELAEKETCGFREGGWRWTTSKSEQCSQMLWAAKAGGEKRPCIDYRYLNSHMVDDGWPLPKITDMTTDAAGKKWLTSLDIPKAYHELRTDPETRHLLAFQCGNEQYEPVVMQFGTKTAVQWWQRFLCHVLRRHLGKGVHVYLDNILVYTDDEKEHDRILADVLEDLEKNHLTVKETKCEWKKHRVQFCGFSIGADGIKMDPDKVAAVRDWRIPHDAKISEGEKRTAVREFLGFTNFCKDKIPDYSQIAAPLTDLTSAKKPFVWGSREQMAFERLKDAFTRAPVVMPFRDDAPKEVFTDASDEAVGGVVCQRVDGKLQPIAFWSQKLSDTQKRYSVHDRELLALRTCFVKHRHWLHGAPGKVIAWTDHSALRHFMKTTEWKDRQVRWGNDLGEFNLEIRHLPGRSNRAADALSRRHNPGAGKKEREEQVLREEWLAVTCEHCKELERRWAAKLREIQREGGNKFDWILKMQRAGISV